MRLSRTNQKPDDLIAILEARLNLGRGDSVGELLVIEGIEACMEKCDKKGIGQLAPGKHARWRASCPSEFAPLPSARLSCIQDHRAENIFVL